MNKTLRAIMFLFATGTILASTCTWTLAQNERKLFVPFGRNKELAPAHDVYQFPYKENYIMLPLTNGQMVTEDGGMRVIVNKPVQINKNRTTVIPLGQGAPNISPTPIVPQGFNGGSVPLPVNRPEGVVVRRIYPQQEFVTSVESGTPEVRTYDEPMSSERTEALPSVVSPEDSNSGLSTEHSIVSPDQATPSETTPSTSVDSTQTTPSPYETYTPSPYETPSGTEYGTQSGTSTPSEYGTPSGTSTPSEYGTQSGTSTPSEYGTPSGTSTPSEYGTQSGTSTPSEYGTPSGTSTPSEYGTPSGTDPYQPDYSYDFGTSQESEAPTSAWRSTTSKPAETYDSGVVGESPMIMTQQESSQSANPWETQSTKPQVQETVSPAVTVPAEQTVNQNSTSSPANQTRYVEVRPRRQSVNRVQQNRNSGTTPAQAPSYSSPSTQPAPAPMTSPQYQTPREVPAQLPPPDPNQQTPKPSADGRKV